MIEKFVSRGGLKLEHALKNFNINVQDKICADFGSSTGGFVDCLLQNGVEKVYAVETGYGTLAWKLRNDKRVVVMERTNALHVELPETVDIITIDTSWTKQKFIVPRALTFLKNGGTIISLVKPHYEAEKSWLEKGKIKDDRIDEVLEKVKNELKNLNINIEQIVESPIKGEKGGNREFLILIKK